MAKDSIKRYGKLCIKLSITALAFYVVFQQIDVHQVGSYFAQIHIGYIVLGLLSLNIGQIASALRLRYYFSTVKVQFTAFYAIALYYVGMLFNHALPSGVGGDGVISLHIKQKHYIELKRSVRLLLSSRANGLLFLLLWTALLFIFSTPGNWLPYSALVAIAGMFVVLVTYHYATVIILKETLKQQLCAARYSVVVQSFNVLSVYFFLHALGHEGPYVDYLMLFMLASVLVLVPISVGGAGLRELTFLVGAEIIGLDQELGVTVALLYFLVNAFSSLAGAFFFFRLPYITPKEGDK
jgi:hypothetical protein